jgi:hypothetical protein
MTQIVGASGPSPTSQASKAARLHAPMSLGCGGATDYRHLVEAISRYLVMKDAENPRLMASRGPLIVDFSRVQEPTYCRTIQPFQPQEKDRFLYER